MRIFVSIILLGIFLGSCSPYQKMLKSEDVGAKFHFADSLYNVGKYRRALKLMEQIVPAFRGKPQAEKMMFIYADTYFHLEDFYLAGYQFDRFTISYPNSQKVEEAAFKSAKSYYELSPRYSLDQKDTYTALDKLQIFINNYSESEYLVEANALVAELITKLEKKRFEIAKQYYHTRDYKASIKAFDNFILDFPGSEFRKETFYLRFEASYTLAINSFPELQEERLLEAKRHYNSFIRYYGESDRKADADKILEDIDNRLKDLKV